MKDERKTLFTVVALLAIDALSVIACIACVGIVILYGFFDHIVKADILMAAAFFFIIQRVANKVNEQNLAQVNKSKGEKNMNATGVVRRIDDCGRITIPKSTLEELGLKEGTALELYREGNFVAFKRYYPECDFCNDNEGDTSIGNKAICPDCLKKLKTAFEKV